MIYRDGGYPARSWEGNELRRQNTIITQRREAFCSDHFTMPRASIFKKNKNIEKGLQNRRRGLMREADDVQWVYGIGVAVLMEINGEYFQYKSKTGLLRHNRPIPPKNQFSPGNVFKGNDSRLSSATPSPKQTETTISQQAMKEHITRKRTISLRASDAAARTRWAYPALSQPQRKEALRSVAMLDLLAKTYFDISRTRDFAPFSESLFSSAAESATPPASDSIEVGSGPFSTASHSS